MMIRIIKYIVVVILLTKSWTSFSQISQDFQQLQGFWLDNYLQDEGFREYRYYEGHYLYNLLIWPDRITASKYYIMLINTHETDSIYITKFKNNGSMYGVIDSRHLRGDKNRIKSSLIQLFAYDIGEDYFNYYANDPIQFTKIDGLPSDLYQTFLEHKKRLDKGIIFDFVPDYLYSGPDPMPKTVKANDSRVYFHTLPDGETKQSSYIIRGDRAQVLQQNVGWFYIIYVGKNGSTLGWVRKIEVTIDE